VYDLSNGAIFNDLERSLPPVSRSHHFYTEYLRNGMIYRHSFNEILYNKDLHTPYSTESFRITLSDLERLKPPSHQQRPDYVLQKLCGRSKNFVQRSRNAVETDIDVIWSPWTWRTWSNLGHVQKNVVRTWSNQDAVRT